MKKNNIGVLITIIILLCVFLPGAIYGTYIHYQLEAEGGNVNKDFYYEGKLFFYDGDKLLGTYTCETENCGYAKNSIDNQVFESFNQKETEIKIINNHFAFLSDGNKKILYDIKEQSSMISYKEVKNYSLGLEGNYFLVKNESDKWGMIKVEDEISVAIPNNYLYLGIKENLTENNKYDTSRIIAQTDQGWNLITNKNNIVASANEMIIDYSSNYIVTTNNKIYDYSGKDILALYQLKEVTLLNTLAIALSNTGIYYIYDSKVNNIIDMISKTGEEKYEFSIIGNELKVTAKGNVIKTIALS